MARAAVAQGKCAVIGLQSTGEARTADVVADKGDELDDFVSGAPACLWWQACCGSAGACLAAWLLSSHKLSSHQSAWRCNSGP
jgi:hypothetical protein